MKKHMSITLLAMVMLFQSAGTFAQENAGPGRTVRAGSAAESLRIRAFRAKDIIGSKVINLEGRQIGVITNLVINIDAGNIVYATLDFGGFLGFRDKLFAVPWQSLAAVPAEGLFVLDQSKATLQKAPGFDKNNWPDVADKQWHTNIYRFYKRQVPTRRPYTAYRRYQAVVGHREHYPFYPGYAIAPYSGTVRDPYGEIFDPNTIETVSGKIIRVEYFEEIKLMLYTDAKKPVLADLGPTGFFESQGKILKRGNLVTVTGSMVTIDDTPILIAISVKEGNEELQLRDKEGHPTWIGWKKIK